jgi:predicted branched-subunit amino acid permease
MDAYGQIADSLAEFGRAFMRDLGIWLSGLQPEHKLLGLVMFAMTIMLFVLRRKRLGRQEGSRSFQFTFALAIVIVVSFGATWILVPTEA